MSVEEKQTQTTEFDPETATYEELAAAAQKEADEEAKRQANRVFQQPLKRTAAR
jgi:hypothetical protein